jgi:hypothetical protein
MASTDLGGVFTIMDVVNEYSSMDGAAQYIWAAKVLARKCPMVRDMHMVASNQIMSNIGARESYLPTPGTRRFNEGIAPSAVHSTPFTDPIAMVEDYSQVDKALWAIQNNPVAWRQDKDARKVEALTQAMEDLIIYGSLATDPGAFNGLCTRFNSSTTYPNNDSTWPYNVVLGGGSGGDTTSILVVQWGPGKVSTIFPKNLPAGLQIEDRGQQTVNTNTAAAPNYMEALITHFAWYLGLTVEDERCVQRYANIEVSGASNTFNEDTLIDCINRLPDGGESPGTVIYVSRSVKTALDIRAKDKQNVYYMPDNVWGGNITMFRGIPVRMAHKLSEAETAVT